MDLGHGMIQNPAAEVAEVVEYLLACEKTLASLYTLADCLISWQARSCEATGVPSRAQSETSTAISLSHVTRFLNNSTRTHVHEHTCLTIRQLFQHRSVPPASSVSRNAYRNHLEVSLS